MDGVARGGQTSNLVDRYRSGFRWVSSARSYVHNGIGFRLVCEWCSSRWGI